jgi:hypothetical protein
VKVESARARYTAHFKVDNIADRMRQRRTSKDLGSAGSHQQRALRIRLDGVGNSLRLPPIDPLKT